MRLRRTNLRTGRLLSRFDATDRARNRSLLFLVGDVHDAAALQPIRDSYERLSQRSDLPDFDWHDVIDQGDLAAVEPQLNASRIERLEASELSGLEDRVLDELLGPALRTLASLGDEPLFPNAGAAGGSPVEGVQLLDRRKELAELAMLVESGSDVALQAPRRSGKTSLLRRLRLELADRFLCEYWDLERHETPEENVAVLWSRLMPATSFRSARALAREGWPGLLRRAMEELVARANLKGLRGVVLLLDELVFLLRHLRMGGSEGDMARRATELLDGLSSALSGLPVRLVSAGSENLDFELEEAGVSKEDVPLRFRQARRYPLPPMTPDDTVLELRRLLLGTGLVAEPDEHQWMVENVDLALPYPALQFLDTLVARLHTGREFGASDLDGLLGEFLEGTNAFADLERHLHTKIQGAPNWEAAAEAALDVIAAAEPEVGAAIETVRSEVAARLSEGQEQLLSWLLATFPLRVDNDRILCPAKLFLAWWRRLGEGAA